MGGSKVDSAFYFSEIDEGSSWGTLCGKKQTFSSYWMYIRSNKVLNNGNQYSITGTTLTTKYSKNHDTCFVYTVDL